MIYVHDGERERCVCICVQYNICSYMQLYMLAIFPRWFATTKENLHKEKSAKKEPPSPPGGGSFLAVFGFLGKPTGKKTNIYAYHLMCQGLVAGLPSDCPGLTWRCSW